MPPPSPKGNSSAGIPLKLLKAFANNAIQECLHYIDELALGTRNQMRDSDGQTLVHLACASSSAELVYQMINPEKRNMAVNVVDLEGNHPLHVAASRGNVEHARILMERGVNPLILNGAGKTAIDVAEECGYDFFATYLKDRSDPRTKEELLGKWPQTLHLIDPAADAQLCWREVEQVAHLQVAVPLRPLPWITVEEDMIHRATFAVLPTPPLFAAGMLVINDEFQFDGLFFRVTLDILSPHGTGTRVVVHETVTEPKCCVEVISAKSMSGITVLRLYVPPGYSLSSSGMLSGDIDFRSPLPSEEAYLNRCGPIIRQALLSQPTKVLHEVSGMICRIYRRWSNMEKFRRLMTTLMIRMGGLKKFLRGLIYSKRLSIVAMCIRLANFERYATAELGKIDASVYPWVKASIMTSRQQRDRVVRCAVTEAKQAYLENMRRGGEATPTHRFAYMLTLDRVLPSWVQKMNVDELSSRLMRRGSSLPRATIMLLRKKNSPVSIDSMARRRIMSVLREMLHCFQTKISYADEIIRQIREDEQVQRYQMEQQMERIREKRKNAAVTARSVERLAAVQPRKFKGDYGRELSPVASPATAPLPRIHSIHDSVPGSPDSNRAVRLDDVAEDAPTHAHGRRGSKRSSQAKVSLVCTFASPIPLIIGNRHNIKRLLVKWDGDTARRGTNGGDSSGVVSDDSAAGDSEPQARNEPAAVAGGDGLLSDGDIDYDDEE